MRLTVVGCAGTFPGPDSPCSAYLIEHDGYRLVLDLGNGAVGNLHRVGDLLNVDAVLISHLHGDHCLDLVGYAYARRYDPRGEPPQLPVWGPAGLRDRIISSFDRPRPDMVDATYNFTDIGDRHELEIGPFKISTSRTIHPIECYAVRFEAGGKSLTYSADTGACDTLVEHARGSDLFLCEASYADGVDNPPGVHLTGAEAADHAKRAEVGHLVITHQVPWNDPAQTMEVATAGFPGPVEEARVCASYDV